MGNAQASSPPCDGDGVLGSVCQATLGKAVEMGDTAACAPALFLFAGACDLALAETGPFAPVVCGTLTTGAGIACGLGVKAARNAASGESWESVLKRSCADNKMC